VRLRWRQPVRVDFGGAPSCNHSRCPLIRFRQPTSWRYIRKTLVASFAMPPASTPATRPTVPLVRSRSSWWSTPKLVDAGLPRSRAAMRRAHRRQSCRQPPASNRERVVSVRHGSTIVRKPRRHDVARRTRTCPAITPRSPAWPGFVLFRPRLDQRLEGERQEWRDHGADRRGRDLFRATRPCSSKPADPSNYLSRLPGARVALQHPTTFERGGAPWPKSRPLGSHWHGPSRFSTS